MKKTKTATTGAKTPKVETRKTKKVNQISLEERLERIRRGDVSDPQYILEMIWSFAKISICDYMGAFENEWEWIRRFLRISEKKSEDMTYQDVAIEIGARYADPSTRERAVAAMELLALPFERYSYDTQRI